MKPVFVVLTRGDRPAELAAAIESIQAQTAIESSEIVVVANGTELVAAPAGVKVVASMDNLGVAGGRNLGVGESEGDPIFFLDDDATYRETDVAAGVLAAMAVDPSIGIVSLRVVDPVSGATSRRHIPRVGASHPERSSLVTTFLGGASAVRRQVFERVGSFPAEFLYAHEETDLAWRALDAGFDIVYRGDLAINHPATLPSRHSEADRLSARNRVWLSRRRLPVPINVIYVVVWLVISMVRTPLGRWRSLIAGMLEGIRRPAGERSAIKWRTVWRMTKLGRPPII